MSGECLSQPDVEWIEDRGLAQVHGERMIYLVAHRVLVGEPAPVMGLSVVPVALHPPATGRAHHQSFQRVVMPGTQRGMPSSRT
jgi:hypothetical protein